jgi:starch phosphorylase
VDWHDLGWTLDSEKVGETLHFRLAEDIVPEYYRRSDRNIPEGWLARMKRTIDMSSRFSAQRMLTEYQNKLYCCETNWH